MRCWRHDQGVIAIKVDKSGKQIRGGGIGYFCWRNSCGCIVDDRVFDVGPNRMFCGTSRRDAEYLGGVLVK